MAPITQEQKRLQGRDLRRGAFFIIDNAGARPDGQNEREFQMDTINKHLAHHTYYFQRGSKMDTEHRTRVDAIKMRSTFNDMLWLFKPTDKESRSNYASPPFGDVADTFFREGTGKLPKHIVQRYDYDRATLREDQLPKFEPLFSTDSAPRTSTQNDSTRFSYKQRAVWIAIQDIDASRHRCGRADYKYRDSEARTSALETLVQAYGLTHAYEGEVIPLTGKELRKALISTWRDHKIKVTQTTLWSSSLSCWNSKYLNRIRQRCDELERRESLPAYGSMCTDSPEATVGQKESDTAESHKNGVDSDSGEYLITGGGVDDEITVGGRERDERTVSTSFEKLPDLGRVVSAAAYARSSSDSLSSLSDAQSDYTPLNKRKRKTSSDIVPPIQKRQHARRTGSKTPPETILQATPSTETVATGPLAFNKEESIVGRSSARPSRIHTTPSGLREPVRADTRPGATQDHTLIDLNINQLARELRDMHQQMANATTSLLSSIGDVGRITMSLKSSPPPGVPDLRVKCWGSQWPDATSNLRRANVLTSPEVILSLCSAYLVEVSNRQSSSDAMKENLTDSGSYGRAVWSLVSKDESFIRKVHALVSQDDSFLQNELTVDAMELANGLWDALSPHIHVLAKLGEHYGDLHDGSNESTWLEAFEPAITSVIRKALECRIRLLGTNCQHNFIWPGTEVDFDQRTMQSDAGVASNAVALAERKVAFTTFPGLEVTVPGTGSGDTQTYVVYKAVVKLYPLPGRQLALTGPGYEGY